MDKSEIVLAQVVAEIRYGSGHLFYDRCGQTLIDIESLSTEWVANTPTAKVAIVNKPVDYTTVSFNNLSFNYNAHRAYRLDIKDHAKSAASLWRIVKSNFGITELIRVGFRIKYINPTLTIEEAEKKLAQTKFDSEAIRMFLGDNFKTERRQILSFYSYKQYDYRMELAAVTQTEGIDPGKIITADPKAMPHRQREVRMAQLKQIKDYSTNPMYGVQLDVDCALHDPEEIHLESHIVDQFSFIKTHFLPLLENI